MTPETCPGCGAKLQPDMLACPNCPMSFPEDDGPVGVSNPLKQSRYWQFVFPVLFFGAIGAAVWYMAIGLLHLGESNGQLDRGTSTLNDKLKTVSGSTGMGDSTAESRAAAGVGSPAGGPAQGAAPAGTAPVEKAPDEGGGGMVIIAKEDAGSETAPPAPEKAAKPVKEWKLRGTVYDLTTLKPLAGCALAFADEETNQSIKTRTDSEGRYRAIVPPLSGRGYSVLIVKSGYAPNYLDPGTEGVPRMAADQRRSMARDLSSALAPTPATVQSVGEKPLITDFYLAPRL